MNNLYIQLPKLVSVSDLQRRYSALLEELNNCQKPLLVLKKNKLEAVILLPEWYQSLIEKTRQYEEQQALASVKIYKRERKEKRLRKMKTINDLFKK